MFSTISWQQYVVFLLIATIVYYILLWIVFYNAHLPILKNLRHSTHAPHHVEDAPDELLHTTQHIIDELRPLFPGRKNKQELLLALQGQLKKYTQWDEPGFRSSLQEFIIYESLTICSIRFSEEDLRVLWL